MSDDHRSSFYGTTGLGAQVMERDARILSTLEVYAKVEKFQQVSSLNSTQFAINSWGYPFIPIPEVKKAFNNVRLAPKNVSNGFLGHPIYWIDPELTERRDNESSQEWCIRMFYLIDALGYWDEHARWVDFLETRGFQFTEARVQTYHNIAVDSVTDSYYLLDEDDFDTSPEAAEAAYQEALKRCAAIQRRESLVLLQTQARQYAFAKQILGDDIYNPDVTFESPGGLWSEKLYPAFSDIAKEYTKRSLEGDPVVSDLLTATRKIYDDIVAVVERLHHAASILELPAKAVADGNPGGAARVSWMATAMSVALSKENMRKVAFQKIDDAIAKAFGDGNIGEGGFDGVINAASETYSTAWNRLRLHYINYQRLQKGEVLFNTVIELNAALTRDRAMSNQFDRMIAFEEEIK